MFSGITTTRGIVRKVVRDSTCFRISVMPQDRIDCRMGDSISVSGACLTVVNEDSCCLSFDISPETLGCTNLKNLRVDSIANLERSLKIGDFLCGHLVTGHVDSVVELLSIERINGNAVWKVSLPGSYSKFLAVKGSVALEGVSLTVNKVESGWFSVNIVPYTMDNTSFATLQVGCKMNMEVDLIARYVERMVIS